MKKFFFVMMCLMAINAFAQNNKFVIKGVTGSKDFDGKWVKLYRLGDQVLVDSAVVKDGAFVISGTTDDVRMGGLRTRGLQLDLVLEPGEIEADMVHDRLSGTPLNDRLNECWSECRKVEFATKLDDLEQKYDKADDAAVRKMVEHDYDSIEAVANSLMAEASLRLFEEMRDNELGAYAMLAVVNNGTLAYDEVRDRMGKDNKALDGYRPLVVAVERMGHLEATAVGKKFTDFDCLNYQTGKMGKLSDVIGGKLALVDFWASWCRPCRQEIMENLIPIYDKFKNKGLLVVGVDVWDKPDAHKKALKDLGIKYPQVVDDTKNATELYGINGIPHIMLVAPDGTILARDLRGDAILEAVRKALEK